MKASQRLSQRIATYPDAEARAVVWFLMKSEAWAVANRLDMTDEQARENVAERVLDFIAGIQSKLP